jgi:hypothetical protein
MENPILAQVSPTGPTPARARARARTRALARAVSLFRLHALFPPLSPAARWAKPVGAIFFEHAHILSRWPADPTSQTPRP